MEGWKSQSCTSNSFIWRDLCWKSLVHYFIILYYSENQSYPPVRVHAVASAGRFRLTRFTYFGLAQARLNFWKD